MLDDRVYPVSKFNKADGDMEKGTRRLLLHHKLINISVHCAARTLNTKPRLKHPARFRKLAVLSQAFV